MRAIFYQDYFSQDPGTEGEITGEIWLRPVVIEPVAFSPGTKACTGDRIECLPFVFSAQSSARLNACQTTNVRLTQVLGKICPTVLIWQTPYTFPTLMDTSGEGVGHSPSCQSLSFSQIHLHHYKFAFIFGEMLLDWPWHSASLASCSHFQRELKPKPTGLPGNLKCVCARNQNNCRQMGLQLDPYFGSSSRLPTSFKTLVLHHHLNRPKVQITELWSIWAVWKINMVNFCSDGFVMDRNYYNINVLSLCFKIRIHTFMVLVKGLIPHKSRRRKEYWKDFHNI